jgi:hypothetical protein
MITTITIEANNESQLIERIEQIRDALKDSSLEDNELMDGSYKVGTSLVEIEGEPETNGFIQHGMFVWSNESVPYQKVNT